MNVRFPQDQLDALDGWAADQADKPSRPEAVRRLVDYGVQPSKSVSLLTQGELAREMAMDAGQYFAAAVRLTEGEPEYQHLSFRMPFNFLLGHTCELAMKSLLAAKGVTAEFMATKLGHDLKKAMRECGRRQIDLEPLFVDYCEFIAKAHAGHEYRYAGRAVRPWIGPLSAFPMIRPQLAQLPWPYRG